VPASCSYYDFEGFSNPGYLSISVIACILGFSNTMVVFSSTDSSRQSFSILSYPAAWHSDNIGPYWHSEALRVRRHLWCVGYKSIGTLLGDSVIFDGGSNVQHVHPVLSDSI